MSVEGDESSPAPARLVVDASGVIKWHVQEVHSAEALRLLADDMPELHAPELMFAEVANILWKKVRRQELPVDAARAIARLVALAPVETHRTAPLLGAAFEIATRTGRTAYDSLYVALAVQIGGRLVTADHKLSNALKDDPVGKSICWIEDLQILPAGPPVPEELTIPNVSPPHSAGEIELLYSFFTGDRLEDADLSRLSMLVNLRELYLWRSKITDAGLVHLQSVADLTTLYLDGTAVTDVGLVHVGRLTNLQTLNLADTAITDAGLRHLAQLANLRKLVLRGTNITDLGLRHLENLSGLDSGDLGSTGVTDAGVEALKRALPRLLAIR